MRKELVPFRICDRIPKLLRRFLRRCQGFCRVLKKRPISRFDPSSRFWIAISPAGAMEGCGVLEETAHLGPCTASSNGEHAFLPTPLLAPRGRPTCDAP